MSKYQKFNILTSKKSCSSPTVEDAVSNFLISKKAMNCTPKTYGRGVRLDILASDSNGHAYHFEVQKDSEGASVQRARFTGAMVDLGLLRKGQQF